MHNFNNIQEALNHIFEGYNISTIKIPGTVHPWFLVDQIRNAIGSNARNNTEFTMYMEHRDEYLAVLTLPNLLDNLQDDNLSCFRSTANGGARRFLIISFPGLFELLRHINAKTSPRVSDFWYWLNNIVLPELYYSPEITEELVDRSKKRVMCYTIDKSRYPYNEYENMRREIPMIKEERDNAVNQLNWYLKCDGPYDFIFGDYNERR